jgi:glycosyltransferase involved in cell wall biosynthesis
MSTDPGKVNTNFREWLGAVVIGRNEGERLRICLESLSKDLSHIVYVDSGSIDGSVELAMKMNIAVVPLDMSQPFTAARARNAGFKALITNHPVLKYMQFIDGDCQMASGWLETASDFLKQNTEYAVACGRRRERFPEKSLYNQLCDIEWGTPIGEVTACGGDALVRVDAFIEVGGYRDELIAGEEPEMCFRLRQNGWKIYRLDGEMTAHDAAILHFNQWWRRNVRAGHAYAEGAHLHGASEEKYWVRECRSICSWGLIIPFFIMLSYYRPIFFLLILMYPLQVLRISFKSPLPGLLKLKWAFFIVLGKLPEAVGLMKYWLGSNSSKIIEYK